MTLRFPYKIRHSGLIVEGNNPVYNVSYTDIVFNPKELSFESIHQNRITAW